MELGLFLGVFNAYNLALYVDCFRCLFILIELVVEKLVGDAGLAHSRVPNQD